MRKSERRRELLEFRQEQQRRQDEIELAANRPPTPPPTSLQDALARVETQQHRLNAVALELKASKQAARNSGEYSPSSGFKLIPEVQKLLEGLANEKVVLQEAVLEKALLMLAEVSGKRRSLVDYNWSWGAGVQQNCDSCSYILSNCKKFDATEAAATVVRVMEDAAAGHEVAPTVRDWLTQEPAVASSTSKTA